MNSILSTLIAVTLLWLPCAQAKIITKPEVARQFIAAVKSYDNAFLKKFKLDKSSVKVGLTFHPLFIAAEVFRNEDFYEVEADFSSQGTVYHYQGKAQVELNGQDPSGQFDYDVYFFGTFENGKSFTRKKDGTPVAGADTFLFQTWKSPKLLY